MPIPTHSLSTSATHKVATITDLSTRRGELARRVLAAGASAADLEQLLDVEAQLAVASTTPSPAALARLRAEVLGPFRPEAAVAGVLVGVRP